MILLRTCGVWRHWRVGRSNTATTAAYRYEQEEAGQGYSTHEGYSKQLLPTQEPIDVLHWV